MGRHATKDAIWCPDTCWRVSSLSDDFGAFWDMSRLAGGDMARGRCPLRGFRTHSRTPVKLTSIARRAVAKRRGRGTIGGGGGDKAI